MQGDQGTSPRLIDAKLLPLYNIISQLRMALEERLVMEGLTPTSHEEALLSDAKAMTQFLREEITSGPRRNEG